MINVGAHATRCRMASTIRLTVSMFPATWYEPRQCTRTTVAMDYHEGCGREVTSRSCLFTRSEPLGHVTIAVFNFLKLNSICASVLRYAPPLDCGFRCAKKNNHIHTKLKLRTNVAMKKRVVPLPWHKCCGRYYYIPATGRFKLHDLRSSVARIDAFLSSQTLTFYTRLV